MNQNSILLAFLLVLLQGWALGQAVTCDDSDLFCTGSAITFPAGTTGYAEPGAYYACLQTQPAPAWFHMLIENPGSISIYMYSAPLVDIDFICWGPFTDPYDPCLEGLTSYTVIDCSYSPNPTEYCDIADGETGQYYILMITNYSLQPAEITFEQTSGSGILDCNPMNPLTVQFSATPTQGQPPLYVQFTDQSTGDPTTWKWDFQNDGIYDSFEQNPTFIYEQAGIYSVKLFISNDNDADSLVYVDYINVEAIPVEYPDLVIQDQNLDQDSVEPGSSLNASCGVHNEGNGEAGSSHLRYYLSSDTIYDGDDLELGSDSVGPLAPGQTESQNETLIIPSNTTTGTWYILFYADANHQTEESDENNNLDFNQLTIYSTDPSSRDDKVKVYPNPARDRLFIDFSQMKAKPAAIELMNNLGISVSKVRYSSDYPGIISIDINELSSGSYFLRISFDDELVYKMILVEN
jgi:PKD repeat protein